jgi:diguanylate cyclase (GGDEF)-like protein
LHYYPDTTREPNYVPGKLGYRSELDVPIKASDAVLGVLIVEAPRVDAFGQDDFDVLQAVANQLAVALENVRLYSEQQQLAMTDDLTGLFNRRYFLKLAQREFLRAHRHQSPCAVLMIDLDGFKRVNDTFGHSGGDDALRRVAKTLASQVRAVDVIARYGGDEFVILLPDCRLPGARQIAIRLQEQSKTLQISNEDQSASLSFSVGIAVAALTPEETLDSLLTRADAEMYQVKQQHKRSGLAL